MLRLGAAALLLAYAGLAIGDGVDRMTRRNPLVAGFVPAPFAAAALSPLASASLLMHDDGGSLASASAAVAVAPLEPSNPGLLGSALFAQGRSAAAESAFRVAGQMGWRDVPTQSYWLQSALLAGDWDVAARRLDAILRLDPSLTRQYLLLAAFESSPKGRAALVERLAHRPNWTEPYFTPGADIPRSVLDDRGEVFVALDSRAPLPCAVGEGYAARLVAAGEVARAHEIWRDTCAVREQTLVHDGSFADVVGRAPGPFDWQQLPNGSVSVTAAGATSGAPASGGGLTIGSDAPFTRAFVRQLIVAPAGHYRLSWVEGPAVGTAAPRIEAAVGCAMDALQKLDAGRGIDGRVEARFALDGDCEGHWLTLSIRPGADNVRVSDVRLVAG